MADEASLLLGIFKGRFPLWVIATPERREVDNMAVIARTRGDKGLLAKTQILTRTGSIIINDTKGDLFTDTASFRSKMSDVYVIDTRGFGNRYDPMRGKHSLGELRGIAKFLLFEPDEGEGRVFTRRALNMLSAVFRAARIEGYTPLTYCASLIHTRMMASLRRLEELSKQTGLSPEDNLATRFLGGGLVTPILTAAFLRMPGRRLRQK
jgi:hypothetical protein